MDRPEVSLDVVGNAAQRLRMKVLKVTNSFPLAPIHHSPFLCLGIICSWKMQR